MELNSKNRLKRDFLRSVVVSFETIIEPALNHVALYRDRSPKEYFAAAVVKKIYSLNISAENVLMTNDIFLINYLYRYIYELYIKILYIFSGSNEEQIKSRLDNYFNNQDLKIAEYLEGVNNNLIPLEFRKKHRDVYKMLSRFAHPNIESLNMHLNKDPNEQFDFLVSTLKLVMWHGAEIVKLLSNLNLLSKNIKIDGEEFLKKFSFL